MEQEIEIPDYEEALVAALRIFAERRRGRPESSSVIADTLNVKEDEETFGTMRKIAPQEPETAG